VMKDGQCLLRNTIVARHPWGPCLTHTCVNGVWISIILGSNNALLSTLFVLGMEHAQPSEARPTEELAGERKGYVDKEKK